jgi:hypothetical protein
VAIDIDLIAASADLFAVETVRSGVSEVLSGVNPRMNGNSSALVSVEFVAARRLESANSVSSTSSSSSPQIELPPPQTLTFKSSRQKMRHMRRLVASTRVRVSVRASLAMLGYHDAGEFKSSVVSGFEEALDDGRRGNGSRGEKSTGAG